MVRAGAVAQEHGDWCSVRVAQTCSNVLGNSSSSLIVASFCLVQDRNYVTAKQVS